MLIATPITMDAPADMVVNPVDGLMDPNPNPPDSPLTMPPASLNPSQGPPAPPPPAPAPAPPRTPQLSQISCHSSIAPQNYAAPPSVTKLDTSRVTRIDQVLDSKRNNWPLWYDSMKNMFEMNDITEYTEGQIRCPDPILDPAGSKVWRQNNAYMKTLINVNIFDNERVHTQGCETAQQMWNNLKTIYKSSDGLVYTDKLQTIFQLRAMETTNIPEHLKTLKKLWDQLSLYNDQLAGDVLFKRIITQSLPHSWNAFTNEYIRGYIDEADRDSAKRVTSQQLISLINQEYNLNESQRCKEVLAQKRSNKNTNTSNANRGASGSCEKKHCNNCRHDNHNDPDCKYKGQTKCSECKRFHDSKECWKNGNKRPWKGKDNVMAQRPLVDLATLGSE